MAHERRAHILRLLAERGSIRSAELAAELGVTDETIRTDLVLLEREGQLRRRHGGAEFAPPPPAAPGNSSRLDHQLASVLLPHIEPHASLAVDASRLTTTLLSLLRERSLTLITHSPTLLQQFAAAALPHRLLCLGGELDKASGRLCPPPGAAAACAISLAILSPDQVEMQGQNVAIRYHHRADQLWAQEVVARVPQLLLAFPASTIRPWTGNALPCTPHLIVTEDNLPPEAEPPFLHLLPWLNPATLLPENTFDY